jgi:hypothetical protein
MLTLSEQTDLIDGEELLFLHLESILKVLGKELLK